MELRIDFYSQSEVSIRVDFAARDHYPDNNASELFLFTYFLLRQMSNLGHNDVTRILAVEMSCRTSNNIKELTKKPYDFLRPFEMTSLLAAKKIPYQLHHTLINPLAKMATHQVEFKGVGKYSFVVKLPPYHLSANGFGPLGRHINQYAFHSVIALLTHIARKHSKEDAFLSQLAKVAQYCGEAYIAGNVGLGDQVQLANSILKNARE